LATSKRRRSRSTSHTPQSCRHEACALHLPLRDRSARDDCLRNPGRPHRPLQVHKDDWLRGCLENGRPFRVGDAGLCLARLARLRRLKRLHHDRSQALSLATSFARRPAARAAFVHLRAHCRASRPQRRLTARRSHPRRTASTAAERAEDHLLTEDVRLLRRSEPSAQTVLENGHQVTTLHGGGVRATGRVRKKGRANARRPSYRER
jgi:hypothetical protein